MLGWSGVGKRELYKAMRNWTPSELQARFPKLRPDNWERRSNATPRYNCMAFANGDERHMWEPGKPGGMYYWPPTVRQDNTADTWEEVFLKKGYKRTDNCEMEVGFEKVAIYVSLEDMDASHVAISDGFVWLSKLGKQQDIAHSSLDLLEGDEYGIVDRVLKRSKTSK